MGTVRESLRHDSFGSVVGHDVTVSGVPLFSVELTRDKLGRITRKVETIEGQTTVYRYAYDARGRLHEVSADGASVAQCAYDSNSNRLTLATAAGTRAAAYDDQERLIQDGDVTFGYSASGALETRTGPAGTTSYDYDELGNLIAADLPMGARIEYLVDGRDRRVARQLNGNRDRGFLYHDGVRVVAELDATDSVVSEFVYASRAATPDYMVRGGNTYRILADQVGSPRLIIDSATGTIAQRINYDPFGRVTRDTNPGFQPLGFAGGLWDHDTGLVRFGARDYDLETGRWTCPIRPGSPARRTYISTRMVTQ